MFASPTTHIPRGVAVTTLQHSPTAEAAVATLRVPDFHSPHAKASPLGGGAKSNAPHARRFQSPYAMVPMAEATAPSVYIALTTEIPTLTETIATSIAEALEPTTALHFTTWTTPNTTVLGPVTVTSLSATAFAVAVALDFGGPGHFSIPYHTIGSRGFTTVTTPMPTVSANSTAIGTGSSSLSTIILPTTSIPTPTIRTPVPLPTIAGATPPSSASAACFTPEGGPIHLQPTVNPSDVLRSTCDTSLTQARQCPYLCYRFSDSLDSVECAQSNLTGASAGVASSQFLECVACLPPCYVIDGLGEGYGGYHAEPS